MISKLLHFFCFSLCCSLLAVGKQPNIILIVADDQGYGEMSCHGNPILQTPHMDQLRTQSVRFTDFHVAPMCTPTRAQLMTGCDAVRTCAVNVSSGRSLLRAEFTLLPEHLKKAGYRTALFGKWHLGDNYPYRPQDRGFEEVLTYPSSHIGALPDTWQADYFDDTYLRNGKPEPQQGYTTDVLFTQAMRWMEQQKKAGRPFFLYLPTAAPHSPHYVPEKYRLAVQPRLQAALPKLPPQTAEQQEQLLRYLAMIENLDENMGRLDAFLSHEQLRENTLLIYLSDNGTTLGDTYYNAGMRGKKTTLWEGGHRVPLFIRWPGGDLGAARDVAELCQAQDLFPTILELAHVEKPSHPHLDGDSLAPILQGIVNELPERCLFINYSRMPISQNVAAGEDPASACTVRMNGAAVLFRNWRLLENQTLYDVKADPEQKVDVAASHPEIVSKLRSELETWWSRIGDKRANEPQRVILGHSAENPSLLTACEWWNVFVDQQSQVRRGDGKNGVWYLQIAEAGEYEIELRRWPRDAALALNAAAPAATLADGQLPAGRALPITQAELKIQGHPLQHHTQPQDQAVTFKLQLHEGNTEMQTWFRDASGRELCGAYYVYIRRL
jgi:arylsulfatase A-like enzyme